MPEDFVMPRVANFARSVNTQMGAYAVLPSPVPAMTAITLAVLSCAFCCPGCKEILSFFTAAPSHTSTRGPSSFSHARLS